MRTKFIYLLLIAAVSGSAAAQDTLSLDDYRLRVLQYSYTLKQAAEQTRAAEAAVRGSYTGFLPQLSADGDFSINFRKRFQSDRLLKPYSFSLQPALVQQIYVGGSVRDSYRQAQVNQDLFRLQEQQSELDVAYLAEYNYWNLASNKALLDITTRYEAIVREMFNVVQTRFDDGYTLVECHLFTGRTHQIRVHMRHINHACVGDPLYGKCDARADQGLTRQFLHSWRVAFDHPVTGERIECRDELPWDLAAVLDDLAPRSLGRTAAGDEIVPQLGLLEA